MPENRYIGSAVSQTNTRASTTTVYVTVPKLRFFMEPRALSFAPAQSISVPSIPKPASSTLSKDISLLSQLVKAPNPLTIALMGLFYSPSVEDSPLFRR